MTLRIENNRAFIGEREFKLGIYSPPMKDGTRYLIEASSSPAEKYMAKLSPSDLKGVLGGMLPSGFEIIVYEARGQTPNLNLATFQNLSQGRCITLLISIYFKNWAYRKNLIYFAEDIRAAVEQKLPGCQSASVSKDEYGVSISIQILMRETDDCSDLFSKTDERLFALYKEILAKSDSAFVEKLESKSGASDEGLRWWVRYVVVPLISGGMGAALIGWAVTHL